MAGPPDRSIGARTPNPESVRAQEGRGLLRVFPKALGGVVWDWGDTLMVDIPGQIGPMVEWPRVEAMPGASMALKALSFCPVQCVATNAMESNGEMVALALARVGLREELSEFFASWELGFAKPDPHFFQEVSRRLGMSPSSLVAVGNDYEKDVVPAKAAGMATILVAAGVDSVSARADSISLEPDLGAWPAADLVVPDLGRLADLVVAGADRLAGLVVKRGKPESRGPGDHR